jgi:hypothetical protein
MRSKGDIVETASVASTLPTISDRSAADLDQSTTTVAKTMIPESVMILRISYHLCDVIGDAKANIRSPASTWVRRLT